MQATQKSTDLQVTLVEYRPTAESLNALRHRYGDIVFDVTTKKGMDEAKGGRKELRDLRIALDDKRKELKAPALERSRLIDAEAKYLTEEIVALEKPIAEQIDAETQRAENERKQREEAELKRVADIRAKVEALRAAPSRVVGRSSAYISSVLDSFKVATISEEEYAEFTREAQAELTIAIASLTNALAGARASEEEAKKIAEQRAELERLQNERAEFERKQREHTEQVRAFEDRAAKEERDRLAREAEAARVKVEPAVATHVGVTSGGAAGGLAPVWDELPGAIPDASVDYSILLTALQELHAILFPGSEEARIVDTALRAVGELK